MGIFEYGLVLPKKNYLNRFLYQQFSQLNVYHYILECHFFNIDPEEKDVSTIQAKLRKARRQFALYLASDKFNSKTLRIFQKSEVFSSLPQEDAKDNYKALQDLFRIELDKLNQRADNFLRTFFNETGKKTLRVPKNRVMKKTCGNKLALMLELKGASKG